MIKIYCECCSETVELKPVKMVKDKLNKDKIWGDLVCSKCFFVIATLSASKEGTYNFKKVVK